MTTFKHNLKTLFKQVEKHYPELNQSNKTDRFQFLSSYCLESSKTLKNNNYHYGYNSLKWLIYSLRNQISQLELERLYKNLIFQFFLLKQTAHKL